ncbi:MAG: hypothetical protein AAGN35_23340 [Bacteroidota bacterium]
MAHNEDDLFDLIKSMTPNEKRYFKRFTHIYSDKGGDKPKYVLLFEAFDELETYDPQQLTENFRDENTFRHLPQEKKYLKDRIMESLRLYHRAETIEFRLADMLQDATIFYEKGLYEQALGRLNKARQLARTYDKFSFLIRALIAIRKLIVERRIRKGAEALAQLEIETDAAIQNQENQTQFKRKWQKILLLYRQEGYRNTAEKRATILAHLGSPWFKDSARATSFSARHNYHLGRSLLLQMLNRIDEAAQEYRDLLEEWTVRSDRIKSDPLAYRLLISNYLNLQHRREQYADFPEYLEVLDAAKTRNFDEEAELFQATAQLKLLYYINRAVINDEAFHAYLELMDYVENGLETYADKINESRRRSLLHNLMILSFLIGDWKGAHQWWQEIDRSSEGVRQEINDFAIVIKLIIDYERYSGAEPDGIDFNAELKAARRKLRRKERLNPFFSAVMSALGKVLKAKNSSARREIFSALKEQIAGMAEQSFLGSIEIQTWVEHHFTGRPIRDVWCDTIHSRDAAP